tara:strand:+ start:82 stop:2043 length:1962 start_codon:yes stop_codon:yes gene_type:complete
MAEALSFEELLNQRVDSISPPTKEELLNRALAESATAAPIRQGILPFLDRGLGTVISGAPSGASYLQEGLGKASSFLGFPEISSGFYEDAVNSSEAGKELREGGFFGAGVSPFVNEQILGSSPEEETFFTGLKVPTPGEMQDTNLLQNPITAKLMNEAAREDIDKLLQSSTPQTYDAFMEENKMGMAPPVGDPAAVRTIEKAEAKKTIEDEAALNRREKALGDTNSGSAEDLFSSAMEDFMTDVRGTGPASPEAKTIDDYKKKFAEATGIDVSGKVDKSSALMAMGLSLMQNKAGKGFNVGKMLSAVGEAGEKALPALNKAKQTARQGVLAAGKYALQMESSDESKRNIASEKAMDRGKYWVYKKGKPGAEFSSFDEGEFVDLNKYELNKLISNPEFDNQFEFISGADRLGILKTRAEGTDYGKEWDSKGHKAHSLIGGDPSKTSPLLTVLAVSRDANYEGPKSQGGFPLLLGTSAETLKNNFIRYQDNLNNGSKRFQTLLNAVNQGVSIPEQIGAGINTAIRALGFTGGEVSDITEAKRILGNIAIDEAILILKETGKTLSDNDRKRVEKRVGEIDWSSADAVQIKKQIKEIYELVILNPQKDLDLAVNNLQTNFGITISPADQPITEEELDFINQQRIAKGLKPRKMEEYQ